MDNDHSLALHLLNTRVAGIKGTIERLTSEIHQAEIALGHAKATKAAHISDLEELSATITQLKSNMRAVVVDAPPPAPKKVGKTRDCE